MCIRDRLLPCYRDMDPYDLPEALSVLQSYDMSKIGFMQDLIRGVKKVIDAGKPLSLYSRWSNAARDFRVLADEVLEVLGCEQLLPL
mgnify:CR=1 FL=1